MTMSVYTISRYSRKATLRVPTLFSPIFSCRKAKQRSIFGSAPSPDVLWKQDGALLWLEQDQGAEGWVG